MKLATPLIATLGLAAILPSCANVATFQEPSTVAKGKLKSGVGVSASHYTVEIGDESESVTVPQVNIWSRYGVTDKLEAHATVWLPLGATVGGKYQLIGDRLSKGLTMSVGADVGYLKLTAGDSESTLVDVYTPLYLGYRASESFVVYATPKYVARFATATDSSGTDVGGLSHAVGASVGMGIGKDTTFFLEGSGMHDVSLQTTILTGGVGVQF